MPGSFNFDEGGGGGGGGGGFGAFLFLFFFGCFRATNGELLHVLIEHLFARKLLVSFVY